MRHLRPVWIVLILLIPSLALTFYYSQIVVPGGQEADSYLPTKSYAFVPLLLNLDLIGFVVLTLLLSRNLIKAYFERRHRLVGAGFRTNLIAAFIGFSLIPTILLAIVASGLSAWDETRRIIKTSLGDRARLAGILDAIRGTPWVLSSRRPIPAMIDRQLQLAEEAWLSG